MIGVTKRIIINNKTNNLEDRDCMLYVSSVMELGLISETKRGKQYCFVTTFKKGITVTCSVSKTNTITFNIYEENIE